MEPISRFTSGFAPVSWTILLLEGVSVHVGGGGIRREMPRAAQAHINPCTCMWAFSTWGALMVVTKWWNSWEEAVREISLSACCPLSSVRVLVKGIIELLWCELDGWGCWGRGEKGPIAFVQALCLTEKARRGISLISSNGQNLQLLPGLVQWE